MTQSTDAAITILFATFNGSRTLPAMLTALEAQEPTRRPWRVVAVNNASKDDTATVLRSFAQRMPIDIVDEPSPGKTTALMTGSWRLSGDLTILTDDDIVPEPGWLRAYEEAADAHPECGLFGGPIVPYPIEALDPWYAATDAFADVLFAKTDHDEGPVNAGAYIFGPNYMARTPVAAAMIKLMQGIGPDQTSTFALGDETIAIEAATANGEKAWFVKAASVRHQVRQRYTTLDYMLKRAQRKGRGDAISRFKGAGDVAGRAGVLAASSVRLASQFLKQAGRSRAQPDPELFTTLFRLNWHIGALRGAIKGPFR